MILRIKKSQIKHQQQQVMEVIKQHKILKYHLEHHKNHRNNQYQIQILVNLMKQLEVVVHNNSQNKINLIQHWQIQELKKML